MFGMGHDCLIDVTVSVVTFFAEPVNNLGNDKGDVVNIELEAGVSIDGSSIINEGNINEMPFLLPLASLHSDIIS
jgi:hypothetical protein